MADTIDTIPKTRLEPRQCPDHGQYQATITTLGMLYDQDKPLERASRCPSCNAAAAAARAQEEARERCRKADRMRFAAGVPARFAEADFENYQVSTSAMLAARDTLANYAEHWEATASSGQCLLLLGAPGTGKTHLATAVINAIADQLAQAVYGTAADLVGGIKAHYGTRGSDQHVAADIAWLTSVPLLVIDEIDVGLSSHDLTLLFRVIDARYSRMQPMVLISNRTLDQLEQQLGQRVMDRLRECAMTVAFDWSSHRGSRRPG